MTEAPTMLERMLARAGKTPSDFARSTKMGKILKGRGVSSTPDLRRVLRLPRRVWKEDSSLDKLVEDLTDWLKTPTGTMRLRPVQAKVLEEIHDFNGGLVPIRTGAGKTLCSMLAPIVLGSERPLLLIPAKLREKTRIEFAELRKHWLFHPRLIVLSYEQVSRDGGYELIEKINPDLVIADECHKLAHTTTGVTRKIRRWQGEHPETKWCFMSGTITSRSLRDYGHLARWALQDLCPLPQHSNELADWADAIDTKIDPSRRLQPGALLGLCNDEELAAVAVDPKVATPTIRKAYRRRLVETPSVIATDEKALGISLLVNHVMLDIKSDCAADFRKLRDDWVTPDDHPFSEAVDLYRHARSLACGLFQKWDPPAPEHWLFARKEWSAFVRKTLASRRKGIDTEFQCAKACLAGEIQRDLYDAWASVRDEFKPNSIPVWRHDKMLRLAAKWLHDEPGVVWCEHVAFGKELSKITGLPYFGEGGVDARGIAIEATDSDRIIASIASNAEGRNLQRWWRNLVVSPPPAGRIWEQMIGRCFREGQEAEEVEFTVVFGCREQWKGMQDALQDAQYVEQTTGQPQKLLFADKDLLTPDQAAGLMQSGNPMWKE